MPIAHNISERVRQYMATQPDGQRLLGIIDSGNHEKHPLEFLALSMAMPMASLHMDLLEMRADVACIKRMFLALLCPSPAEQSPPVASDAPAPQERDAETTGN